MKHLHLVEANDHIDIESMIKRYDDLNRHIKTLEIEKEKLKATLINNYFKNYSEFKDSRGIVLATYKSHIRSQFKTNDFKTYYPELYENYSEEKVIYTLVIK